MRVFVTGATGVVGRLLIPRLIRHGHDVVGLARTDAARAMLHAMQATAYSGHGRNVDRLSDALQSVHAIVHLARTLPTSEAAVEDEWTQSSQVIGGMLRYLIEASANTGVRTLVFASHCSIYGDHADQWVTEQTLPARTKSTTADTYHDAEHILLSATSEKRVSGVVMRMGIPYASDSPQTKGLLYALSTGVATLIGNGNIYWPHIHAADAAQAIHLALEHSPSGEVFNVCDDEPVTMKKFFNDVAMWVGGPAPRDGGKAGTPLPTARSFTPLYYSVRMSNEKLKQLGFRPGYPTYREGYQAVIEAQ